MAILLKTYKNVNSKFFPNFSSLGIAYFNSKQGCGKCKAAGQHNTISRTTVFTQLDAPKRTDADFREDSNYGPHSHHREKSPLLQLVNFDMVKGRDSSGSIAFAGSWCDEQTTKRMDKRRFS